MRQVQSEIKIQRQQFPENYKSKYPVLGIATVQKADTNVQLSLAGDIILEVDSAELIKEIAFIRKANNLV